MYTLWLVRLSTVDTRACVRVARCSLGAARCTRPRAPGYDLARGLRLGADAVPANPWACNSLSASHRADPHGTYPAVRPDRPSVKSGFWAVGAPVQETSAEAAGSLASEAEQPETARERGSQLQDATLPTAQLCALTEVARARVCTCICSYVRMSFVSSSMTLPVRSCPALFQTSLDDRLSAESAAFGRRRRLDPSSPRSRASRLLCRDARLADKESAGSGEDGHCP